MAVKQAAVDKINGMNKREVNAFIENIDLGMADEAYRPYAEKRLGELTPKSNPLFPKQEELDKLISERDGLNAKIKALAKEAEDGGFSFKTEAKGRVRNTGRPSKSAGAGAHKRGNASDLVITVNGTDFTSWKAVCDVLVPTLVADKAAKGTAKENIGWRAEAYIAAKKQNATVVLTFKSAEKLATYEANNWLPESFTVVKSF